MHAPVSLVGPHHPEATWKTKTVFSKAKLLASHSHKLASRALSVNTSLYSRIGGKQCTKIQADLDFSTLWSCLRSILLKKNEFQSILLCVHLIYNRNRWYWTPKWMLRYIREKTTAVSSHNLAEVFSKGAQWFRKPRGRHEYRSNCARESKHSRTSISSKQSAAIAK